MNIVDLASAGINRFDVVQRPKISIPVAEQRRSAITAEHGMTLIEVVIAITVMGIAALSVMSVMATAATSSGQSLIDTQAAMLASAYMAEITSKPVDDPDGVVERGRGNFDNVDDFNGLNDVGARDRQGTALAGFAQFTVTVNVTSVAWQGIVKSEVRLINISVRHSTGSVVNLSAYRLRGVP